MWRALKKSLLILVTLLLLGTAVLTAMTASETGSRWLVRQALALAPGELQVEVINGRLVSGLTLTGVHYRLEQQEIAIGWLTIGWRVAPLLSGAVRVSTLVARDVSYREPETEPPPEAEPFVLPERIPLPLTVQFKHVQVSNLQVDIGSSHTVVDDITLSARAGPVLGLRIRQFGVRMAGSTLQLSGKAALQQPYGFRCDVQWTTDLPDAITAGGEATLDGNMHAIKVQHTLATPFQVTSDGHVQLDGEAPRFEFSGQWRELRWPLSGTAEYLSERGEYQVSGTADAYDLTLNGPLAIPGMPAMQVQAKGRGNPQGMRVEGLDIEAFDGRLAASGDMAWSPAFRLGLAIDATGLNPGVQWHDWPGRLAMKTHLDIDTGKDAVTVALNRLDLQGTLRDCPVAARGDLRLDDGIPGSTGLRLSSGSNRVDLSGRLDTTTGLRYRIEAPELAAVLPGLAGRVHGDGRIKGPMDRPSGHVNLSADGLAYQGNAVRTLKVQARLDAARPQASSLDVTAADAQLGQTSVDSLVLKGEGGIARHRVTVEMTAAQKQVSLKLQGGYREAAWDGVLNVATLDLRDLGHWQLQEPVNLRVAANQVRPFQACWQSQQRHACVRGSLDNDRLQLALSGESAEGRLQGDITLSQLSASRQPLAGNISLDVPDLQFLDPLLPDVSVAGGAAAAEVRLAGYLDAPAISGTASLGDGRAIIPELGVEVKNVGLQAQGKGADITLQGTADSADGHIALSGNVSLEAERAWPFDLTLKGERFGVSGLPDRVILASPDLRVAGSLQQVDITGTVFVPQARIVIKKLPAGVVSVSADQVIVTPDAAPAEQAATPVPVRVNLVARLGDDVHFEGFGLSTDLAGGLDIRSVQTGALIGNGVLELRNGRYEGYGQKLSIRRGRLLFAGPLDNPALDIQAIREVGDVTAGLELTGNADAPQTQLFSEPAMSDGEVMSYLVTGKPLGAASTGNESQALMAAAASLGANNPVSQEISEKLGIDLGVQSGASDEDTALTVGKQLSPRLYIDYIYGMFTETATFEVIYKLTDHLSLTGQSGAQQSIDLKLSIDRK